MYKDMPLLPAVSAAQSWRRLFSLFEWDSQRWTELLVQDGLEIGRVNDDGVLVVRGTVLGRSGARIRGCDLLSEE